MRRPRFFLSSTIYDFHDLRSAIKFYLEAQGCEVRASDYTTFGPSLLDHSYKACIDLIEPCDYFILLIGTRVGGFVDVEKNISITQAEYRAAYELHKSRGLQLLNFVRREVWQVRESRKDLEAVLRDLAIEAQTAEAIKKHKSKFAEDADFISRFIDEVSRNEETVRASKGKGEFPTGNWVHQFSEFREIVEAIQPRIFRGIAVDEAVERRSLERELLDILGRRLIKIKTTVGSPEMPIVNLWKSMPLAVEDLTGQKTMSFKEWSTLLVFCLAVKGPGGGIEAIALQRAIVSPTFLKYNSAQSRYEETPALRAMVLLKDEIDSFNRARETEDFTKEMVSIAHNKKGNDVSVKVALLVEMFSLAFRAINIVNLCVALIEFLRGGEFVMPELRLSPISRMDKELKAEVITQAELEAFLLQAINK